MLNGLSSPAATIAHPAELRAHKTDCRIDVIETSSRSSNDKGGTPAAARLPLPKPAGSGVRESKRHVKWPFVAYGDHRSPS
jgi:hypothetical protein